MKISMRWEDDSHKFSPGTPSRVVQYEGIVSTNYLGPICIFIFRGILDPHTDSYKSFPVRKYCKRYYSLPLWFFFFFLLE